MNIINEQKIIFIDIDGTLLDEKGDIPQSAIQAIRLAQQNNHLVFISTGRCKAEITQDILDINFDGIIAASGAYIEYKDTILRNTVLSSEQINLIEDLLFDAGVCYWYEGTNGVYAHKGTKDFLFKTLNRLISKNPLYKDNYTKNFSPFINRIQEVDNIDFNDIHKCTFDSLTLSYKEIVAELEDSYHLTPCSFGLIRGEGGEINIPGITKATGAKIVLEHLNIPLTNSFAYGDSSNDLEILQFVHVGVAMGNAPQYIKDIANQTTDTPLNNGIYNSFAFNNLI